MKNKIEEIFSPLSKVYSQPASAKLQYFFVELFFGAYKIKFLSAA